MTFSLTALVALLMGLFFFALSGPGWSMCLSSRESSQRGRMAALRLAKLPQSPATPRALQVLNQARADEPWSLACVPA